METINQTISQAKDKVKQLIREAQEKKLEAEPGRTMMDSFENRVNQVLTFDILSLLYLLELLLDESDLLCYFIIRL